jgi:hypothetical protein
LSLCGSTQLPFAPNPPKNKTPAQSPHSVEAEPDHACTSRGLGQRVPPQPHTSPRGQSPGGRLGTRMRPSVLAPRPAAMACLFVEGDALGLWASRRRVPRGRSATDKTRGELFAEGKDGPGSSTSESNPVPPWRSCPCCCLTAQADESCQEMNERCSRDGLPGSAY